MNLLTEADVIDAVGFDALSTYDRVRTIAKRCIDVLGAVLMLVLSSPAFVIVAIIIKLDSRGPVFFSHWRLGRDGRHFPCLKFRSMKQDAESELHRCEELRHEYVSNHFKIPAERDPRITRFGRFLRKSSVDELPQLFNVLRGDMSLVGPRPIVPVEGTHYGDQLGTLLSVRPGLTGAWAVGGRNRVGYPERADLELAYATEWTLRNDVKILLQTPWAVVTQRGAM
ncbi:MAG TPA: sugar transferase [Gemmatimonadaceae bacterium]|jgi:lipopolysaccharide/colanic/teichoic acid biosynthesis glycosyltransferase